jgi:hypothetical protein
MHDLCQRGDANVTVGGDFQPDSAFFGIEEQIESVEWMDNGEDLDFSQKDGVFSFDATGYPYGTNTCVRVARAKIKK